MIVLRVGRGAWDPRLQIRVWEDRLGPDRGCQAIHGEGWAALVCGREAHLAVSEDGPVVFQGRVHHQDDLRRKLGSSSNRLESDVDLATAAIRKWGEDAPIHLEGSWGYAHWNPRIGRLTFVTDHVSTQTLYHAAMPDGYLVSTHLPLVVSASGFERVLDGHSLAMMITGYPRRNSTAWIGVETAAPGTSSTWVPRGGVSVGSWWEPQIPAAMRKASRATRLEHVRAAWDAAIAEAVRDADIPGMFLSSGLDSTLVAGSISPRLAAGGRSLVAITESPDPSLELPSRPRRILDEWPLAETIGSLHPNIDHRRVLSGSQPFPDIVSWIHERFDTPVRNSSNFGWIKAGYALGSDLGVNLMLWGARGNATISFHADPTLAKGEALAGGHWREWLSMQVSRPSLRSLLAQIAAGAFPNWWIRRVAGRHFRAMVEFLSGSPFHRELIPGILSGLAREVTQATASRKAFTQLGARGFGARVNECFDITNQDPTSDRRLIEACLGLPLSDSLFGDWNRMIARELGEGRVPNEIRFNRTPGVQAAETASQLRRDADRLRELWTECINEPWLSRILDLDKAQLWFEEILASRSDNPQRLLWIVRCLDVALFLRYARIRLSVTRLEMHPPVGTE